MTATFKTYDGSQQQKRACFYIRRTKIILQEEAIISEINITIRWWAKFFQHHVLRGPKRSGYRWTTPDLLTQTGSQTSS